MRHFGGAGGVGGRGFLRDRARRTGAVERLEPGLSTPPSSRARAGGEAMRVVASRSCGTLFIASLVAAAAVFPGCDDDPVVAATTYSDATFSGVWLLWLDGVGGAYVVPDGAGTVTEFGAINQPTPAGTFLVTTGGALSITFNNWAPVTAQFDSPGHASLTSMTGDLYKVTDLGRLQGTWSGALIEDGSGQVRGVSTMDVGFTGYVSSVTGDLAPATGKMFGVSNGRVAGLLDTGESGEYQQVHFSGTLTLSPDTISGTYDVDGSATGSILLTR